MTSAIARSLKASKDFSANSGRLRPKATSLIWRSVSLSATNLFTKAVCSQASKSIQNTKDGPPYKIRDLRWLRYSLFSLRRTVLGRGAVTVSYTHLRAHETGRNLV